MIILRLFIKYKYHVLKNKYSNLFHNGNRRAMPAPEGLLTPRAATGWCPRCSEAGGSTLTPRVQPAFRGSEVLLRG